MEVDVDLDGTVWGRLECLWMLRDSVLRVQLRAQGTDVCTGYSCVFRAQLCVQGTVV